jgi:hypothetical protein
VRSWSSSGAGARSSAGTRSHPRAKQECSRAWTALSRNGRHPGWADRRVAQLLYATSMMPAPGIPLPISPAPSPRRGWIQATTAPSASTQTSSASCSSKTATRPPCSRRWPASHVSPRCPSRSHRNTSPGSRSPRRTFLCTEDLAIPSELQRQRASPRLIDFPSGHHPFLSQPRPSPTASPPRSTRSPNPTDGADSGEP